ncbi:MAG: AI-2E family transporter [Planctomycetota bacterium]
MSKSSPPADHDDVAGESTLPGADWPLSFRLAAALIIVSIGILALSVAESVFRPFFVAVFLTFALRPMTGFCVKVAGSTIVGYVLAATMVGGLCFLGGQVAARDVAQFDESSDAHRIEYAAKLNDYVSRFRPTFQRFVGLFSESGETPVTSEDDESTPSTADSESPSEPGSSAIKKDDNSGLVRELLREFDPRRLMAIAGSGTSAFLSFISDLIIILIFMLFLMVEIDQLPQRIRGAYDGQRSKNILRVIDEIDQSIQRYVALKVVISLITALASALVMWIFGVHYITTFAILVFLLNFIPYIGSLVATIIPAVVYLLQEGTSPWGTLGLVSALTGVQQVIGNLVEPRIQGKGLGLSPVAILLALAFWGWLWGITGMILAAPITVTVKLVLQQFDSTASIARLLGDPQTNESPALPSHEPPLGSIRA